MKIHFQKFTTKGLALMLFLSLPLLAVSGATRGAETPAAPAPPRTPAHPVTETLHGVTLTDPYRWLEDQNSSATRQWITEQNAYTRAVLDRLPGRDKLSARLGELLRVDRIGVPEQRGNRYFFTRRLAGQDLGVICLREGLSGKDEPLIDPHPLSPDHTVSVLLLDVSDDGKTLVYGVRAGGQDEFTLHLFDVDQRKELPVGLPKGLYEGVSLTADKTGLYYDRRSEAGGRVYYHSLKDAAAQPYKETYLFGEQTQPEQWVSARLSEDRRTLLIHVQFGWGKRTDLYAKDVVHDGPLRPLITGIDAEFMAQAIGDTLYVMTNWKAPGRRILATDLNHPGAPEAWRELVPERPGVIIDGDGSFTLAGGRLFLKTMKNVIANVEIYSLQNGAATRAGEIAFPDLGTIGGLSGRWDGDEIFFDYDSYLTPPTIYRYGVKSGARAVWSKTNLPFDAAPYETRQVWYPSPDGTRIPMFVTARKGLTLDGNNPTILYGYGGFNISLQPAFSPLTAAWIERGGVYAVANLRGGSEFGEAWHRAGMLDKKQNVFDDFAAAARWLGENKYASPAHLAVMGGSNGGLLVGTALTQHPELYRAVVCSYPLLDMIRYHQFLQGKVWVPEYGSAEDAAQFKTLLGYSPYQHVKAGTRYPAVMFITGDADTRVAPLHARKMAALLQATAGAESPGAAASGVLRPILLHYDTSAGHSAGRSVKKSIEDLVDELSFLSWQLK